MTFTRIKELFLKHIVYARTTALPSGPDYEKYQRRREFDDLKKRVTELEKKVGSTGS